MPMPPFAQVTLLCVFVTLTMPACSSDEATTVSAVSKQADGTRNKDCWWQETDGHDLVAVWLGPRLSGEVKGGFRFVNLVFHDARTTSPIAMISSVARLNGRDPVSMRNKIIEVVASPRPGRNWRDVVTREDLRVSVTRGPRGESKDVVDAAARSK